MKQKKEEQHERKQGRVKLPLLMYTAFCV